MRRTRKIDEARAAENCAKLPEKCYTYLNTEPTLIIMIKRGEGGYYPVRQRTETVTAESLNAAQIRVPTEIEIEAMTVGSMFGFDCPGADVDVIGDKLPATAG